ncbi:unnamed protein product [Thlaspi arvense]|uniref:Uncharacterized protein n=1 Tax=Thlaspi arvense TaxID=13288 RepID=A0AAU9RV83_THLAR|nr:unnamed protein product [Thlaspi arvense]
MPAESRLPLCLILIVDCVIMANQQQVSYHLIGFPLALQLLALDAIPALSARLPVVNSDDQTIAELVWPGLPSYGSLTLRAVLAAEWDPELAVQPTIDVVSPDNKDG